MIHFRATWPFLEFGGTRQAREEYKKVVEQRPRVDSLSAELIRRGQVNHFAEQWEQVLRDGRGEHDSRSR